MEELIAGNLNIDLIGNKYSAYNLDFVKNDYSNIEEDKFDFSSNDPDYEQEKILFKKT